MGLLYDSSLMADDDPYELLEEGAPTGIVELPVEWIRDDMPYFGFDFRRQSRPHTPPSSVLGIFKAEFDGAHTDGGVFQLTMHPHIIGHRSRMASVSERMVLRISSSASVATAKPSASSFDRASG